METRDKWKSGRRQTGDMVREEMKIRETR